MNGAAPHRPSLVRRRQADLALLGVAALWGATFVAVKDALDAVGPLTFVAARFGLSTLAMVPLLLAVRGRRPRIAPGGPAGVPPVAGAGSAGGVLLAGAVLGLLLLAGYVLQTLGLQFIGAGRAGFITGLNVVLVPLLAASLARRLPPRSVALGVLLAALGLGLISGRDLLTQSLAVTVGDILVLGCAVAFALHILAVERLGPGLAVLPLTFVQIVAVAVISTALALAWESPAAADVVAVWPAAAFTGLLCTVLAFGVQVQAQRFTTATHTALIFSAEPVFALLFAVLFGGETPGPAELAGCVLILGGMVVVQLHPEHA